MDGLLYGGRYHLDKDKSRAMEKAKTEQILEKLCHEIGGDWLLVGGTLVQIYYDGARSTEDIDLVQISHPSKSREVAQNELFRFTQDSWGMGPEYVNLSVEYFVRDLSGWESEVRLLRSGSQGRIFRPSLTLFCALKARRGSELDLQDIQSAIRKEGLRELDREKLKSWVPESKQSAIDFILK